MSNLTLNQLYKKYQIKSKTPFNVWLKSEKYIYEYLQHKGDVAETKSFEEWINERYQNLGGRAWFNADGEVDDKNKQIIELVIDSIEKTKKDTVATRKEVDNIKKENEQKPFYNRKFLGVHSGIWMTLLLTTSYITYSYLKNKNNKE